MELKVKLIETSNKKFSEYNNKKGTLTRYEHTLLFTMSEDHGGVRTSTTVDIDYLDSILTCKTLNSVYTFKVLGKKSKAEAEKRFGNKSKIASIVDDLSEHLRIGQIFSVVSKKLEMDGKDLFQVDNEILLTYLKPLNTSVHEHTKE